MKIFAQLIVLFICLNSCKQSDENFSQNSDAQAIKLDNASSTDASAEVADEAMQPNEAKSKAEITAPKIIKEGNLRFETDDLDLTYKKIINALKKNNATIENDVEGKDNQSIFRNITVRVPNKNFDLFLKDITDGVNYFDRKEISAKDVSEEYIDVEARLKAKKVLEQRYFELLKKAHKVSEMIEIETQMAAIREEIDAKEGQLQYMKSRVAMSTISIEFYKSVAQESGANYSFWGKLWNALVSGFNNISSFFIYLVQLWPFIVIFVASFYFIRRKIKK